MKKTTIIIFCFFDQKATKTNRVPKNNFRLLQLNIFREECKVTRSNMPCIPSGIRDEFFPFTLKVGVHYECYMVSVVSVDTFKIFLSIK